MSAFTIGGETEVPRVWEKLYAGLQAALGAEQDGAWRAGAAAAIEIGLRKVRAEQAALDGAGPGPDDELLAQYAAMDDAVFAKLRERLGLGRVRWAIVGAAPTPPHVLEFFAAIGIPLCELWGMSELSTIATLNPPERGSAPSVFRFRGSRCGSLTTARSALFTLDPEVCAGMDGGATLADVAGDPAIEERIREAVNRANQRLARVEEIKRFKILPDVWEPGGGVLTPTMKLKRKPIAERYAGAIDVLYDG